MALPCEICPNRNLVQLTVDEVNGTFTIIESAAESIRLYEAQYNDADLANDGPDESSDELLRSLPGRREALETAREKLEQHMTTVDSIICGNLITCFKPALIDMVNKFALDEIKLIFDEGPQE